MNYRMASKLMGVLLIFLAGMMLLPLAWGFYFREELSITAFAFSILITVAFGGLLAWFGRNAKEEIYVREGLFIVALGWILAGLFGALPYILSGTLVKLPDAFFETISGFTTTGSTVLTDIEAVDKAVLFWRSLTHWLGGMGIIVLFIAVMPHLGVGGKFLFKSEVPGPITEGLKPRIKETAYVLWLIYFGLTAAETIFLLFGGMDFFESLCHSFGTMATGGFSTKNASVGHYNSVYIDVVITIFMFLAGINFTLYYFVFKARLKEAIRDPEFRVYLLIVLMAILLVTLNLILHEHHASGAESLQKGAFQAIAIVTTTGYGTDDFNVYPAFSKILLMVLMFVGASAGSTGGGMKVFRIMILFKHAYYEVRRVIRPREVVIPKIGGQPLRPDIIQNVTAFFILGIGIFILASMIMGWLGTYEPRLDITTSMTAVAATLWNIGPGLERVGSIENYAFIPSVGKWVLSLCMLMGRLEIYTVLVLFFPSFWRK